MYRFSTSSPDAISSGLKVSTYTICNMVHFSCVSVQARQTKRARKSSRVPSSGVAGRSVCRFALPDPRVPRTHCASALATAPTRRSSTRTLPRERHQSGTPHVQSSAPSVALRWSARSARGHRTLCVCLVKLYTILYCLLIIQY